jgi:large subunit ribosomal protein L23
MRDYLKRLYGVDVLNVRSYVEQQKVTRLRPLGKFGYGKLRRPESKKKMTVEMKVPFVWPDAPADMSAYVIPFLVSLLPLGFSGARLDGMEFF